MKIKSLVFAKKKNRNSVLFLTCDILMIENYFVVVLCDFVGIVGIFTGKCAREVRVVWFF